MKKLFNLFVAISLLPMIGLAQTGPGGVGAAGTNPVWYDANELNLSNGASVSNFPDMSGNGNDMTQLSSVNQPTFTTGTINGLPAVVFDGTTDYLERGATGGLDGGEITVFAVFQRTLGSQECIINGGYTGQSDKWRIYDLGNNRIVGLHKSPGAYHAFMNEATGGSLLVSTHFRGSGTRIYSSGTQTGNNSTPYSAESGHNLLRMGIYNANTTNYHLDGYIAELVVLNFDPNNLERRLVENYLGNKYGFTIANDWYAYEATHNIGIIGIGNDGSNSHTDSRGSGVLQINGATGMTSGEYLLCGHTNTDLSSLTTADLPATLPTHSRWTRTWRAGETGDVGTVTITYHLSGGNNFGASASYRLLVDDITQNGDFSDATEYSGTYNSGAQTMTFTVNLNDGDYFTLAGIEQQLFIESVVATGNWSDPNSWDCTCVPTGNDEVLINPGHNITVDTDAEVLNLAVSGTLTMTTAFTLSIFGAMEMDGSAVLDDGTIAFVGSTDQYIDIFGGSIKFNDLVINNSGSANVEFYEAEYLLNGLLSPIQGTMVLENANTQFIVNSESGTTDGRVGPIQGGAGFTGDFTVRRFIPTGNADWRDIASPVVGATLSDWDADLEISCDDCPDGCAYGQPGGGCFESVTFWTISTQYGISTISHTLVNGRGYEVWVGDDLNNWTGKSIDATGTFNTGNVVETISSNWHTGANPYACPVDFDGLSFSGVGKYFYIYDTQAGDWQWYDLNSTTSSTPDLADGVIAIGQGIWLKGPGTLTFTQADKVTTTDATFIRGSDTDDHSIYVKLSENSSTFSSKGAIEASFDGTDGYDDLFDVSHLEMPDQKGPSFSFIADEELVRKTYVAKDLRDKILPVHMTIRNEGLYTISVENVDNFTDYAYVYIVDRQTGDQVELKEEGQYVFQANEGTDDERFVMILSNERVEETQVASFLEHDVDNGISITQLDHVLEIQISDQTLENVRSA